MAGLGEGPGVRASPLFWVKNEEITEGREAGWASKIEPGPILCSKSGSATALVDRLERIKVRNKHFLVYSKYFLVLLFGRCIKYCSLFGERHLDRDLYNPSVAHKRCFF